MKNRTMSLECVSNNVLPVFKFKLKLQRTRTVNIKSYKTLMCSREKSKTSKNIIFQLISPFLLISFSYAFFIYCKFIFHLVIEIFLIEVESL